MKTRFIGDIHGKWESYLSNHIMYNCEKSVQIGDFGVGFNSIHQHTDMIKFQHQHPSHRFIRGNHDDPAKCISLMPGYITDGFIEDNVMYIGGAWSIDRHHRTEGVNWWADEELSYSQFNQLIEIYEFMTPDIMVTHDCPSSFSKHHLVDAGRGLGTVHYPSITGEAFEAMLTIHQPKIWIFGHWHVDLVLKVGDTTFICLDELSYLDVDTTTCEIEGIINYGKI